MFACLLYPASYHTYLAYLSGAISYSDTNQAPRMNKRRAAMGSRQWANGNRHSPVGNGRSYRTQAHNHITLTSTCFAIRILLTLPVPLRILIPSRCPKEARGDRRWQVGDGRTASGTRQSVIDSKKHKDKDERYHAMTKQCSNDMRGGANCMTGTATDMHERKHGRAWPLSSRHLGSS